MIDEIQVENLALIRHAELRPSSGMTVLTGETGAGKTALISACKLLMGERSDRNAVREGAPELCVSGRFFMQDSTDELVVSRSVRSDGRSRMSINGRMAATAEARSVVAPLIDLCGQHEHQRLMRTSEHMHMLDAWAAGDLEDALVAYREAFDAASLAQVQLDEVRTASQAHSAKLDEARFVCARIDEIAPEEGEYERVRAYLAKAEHAESLLGATRQTHEALAGDRGALDTINEAVVALQQAANCDDSLASAVESLRETVYVIEDVARDAQSYADSLDFDEETLRSQQERAAALQGLMRSYGPRMEDVFERSREAHALLELVDDAETHIRDAEATLAAAEARLNEAAQQLAQARAVAAPQFAEAVTANMARLCMADAHLECAFEDLPRTRWTRDGSQSLEFLFCPAAGMQPRPLTRIASGGEISRVMLAIKVVLGQRDSVDTLIFDEVDAGVGGAAAVALAEVLADLAHSHQLIVVTHLAQLAVRADTHYLVSKVSGDTPETQLHLLGVDERPAEIARMLSGSASQASLAHAHELLEANTTTTDTSTITRAQ